MANIPQWKVGDVLSASKLNAMVNAINDLLADQTGNNDVYITLNELNDILAQYSDIGHTHSVSEIVNLVLPTKLSQLQNDISYATEDYVTNAIANAQLDGGVDLSGYATKEYVDNAIANDQPNFQFKINLVNDESQVGVTVYGTYPNLIYTFNIPVGGTGGIVNRQPIDIFVMSGQSNMQGQSESFVEFTVPINQAYEYKLLSDSLEQVKHPFGEDVGNNLFLSAHLGRSSLSPYFAQKYYETTGVTPVMVQCAKGSTTINQWLKSSSEGNARYNKLIEKTNSAVECVSENDNMIVRGKYFVWLQGESDGLSQTTKSQYKERFLELWTDLKTDCGFNKCFIIRVAKFGSGQIIPIIEAQEELAAQYDDIIMVTRITGYLEKPALNPTNPTLQDGSTKYYANDHYTNAGYKLVGETAASKIGAYILSGTEPVLEEEPYDEMKIPDEDEGEDDITTKRDYEFNFRNGVATETENDISSSVYGELVFENQAATVEKIDGVVFDEMVIFEGEYTITFTGSMSKSISDVGALLTNVDNNGNKCSVFYYRSSKTFRLVTLDSGGTLKLNDWKPSNIDWESTSSGADSIFSRHNFTIQVNGDVKTLFVDGVNVGSVNSTGDRFEMNGLFGTTALQWMGVAEYFRICDGIVSPELMDAVFFA